MKTTTIAILLALFAFSCKKETKIPVEKPDFNYKFGNVSFYTKQPFKYSIHVALINTVDEYDHKGGNHISRRDTIGVCGSNDFATYRVRANTLYKFVARDVFINSEFNQELGDTLGMGDFNITENECRLINISME
jgi:hypothetical protein